MTDKIKCSKCEEPKEASDFYKNRKVCIACYTAQVTATKVAKNTQGPLELGSGDVYLPIYKIMSEVRA